MDMKKYLLMLALIIPLMAQDSTAVVEESLGKRAWMGLQDMDFKKYQAAHSRVHMKQGGMKRSPIEQRNKRVVIAKRNKMHKKRAIRSFVRIVVIGGVAYYIGYTQGQKKHYKHPGKRGDKK